jgi:hypothetical protein
VIPFGAVALGVAIVALVIGVAWAIAEVVWAVREVRRRHQLPEYEIVFDAYAGRAHGWSSVDVGNVRYWVPATDPEETP